MSYTSPIWRLAVSVLEGRKEMSVRVYRYPRNCTWLIGYSRMLEVGKALRRLGFKDIKIRSTRSKGIDFKVFDRRHNLILAVEVTNYNLTSYQNFERFKGVRDKLNDIAKIHNCKKLFIASFERNFIPFKKQYAIHNIDVIVLGFQTVPKGLFDSNPKLFPTTEHNFVRKLRRKGYSTQTNTTLKLKKYLRDNNLSF